MTLRNLTDSLTQDYLGNLTDSLTAPHAISVLAGQNLTHNLTAPHA